MQNKLNFFSSLAAFGTEFEATKWLVRDIAHDLGEIRRCADCFRYSHEQSSLVWFSMPCFQRHELVFAKFTGFPYWPAKVIRVLSNSKYDVRFFGGSHSRALVDVRCIKPIDTDQKSLKMGNSSQLKYALNELRYHQLLATYPPAKFSFHADPNEIAQIIATILNINPLSGDGGIAPKKRGRKSKRTTLWTASIQTDTARLNLRKTLPVQATAAPLKRGRKAKNSNTALDLTTSASMQAEQDEGEEENSQTSIIQCAYGNDTTDDEQEMPAAKRWLHLNLMS